ncbi:hypothetical protein [Roseicitreum antarcticum]|uniref:hypothetical protein n=1 Tax=Roseicitreum antarcticum TaxID=564137 RepID=UPI0015A423D4|nr:hypothetical protein [Roseicitreum antarcticum]
MPWKIDQPAQKPIIQAAAKDIGMYRGLMRCQGCKSGGYVSHIPDIDTKRPDINIFFDGFFRLGCQMKLGIGLTALTYGGSSTREEGEFIAAASNQVWSDIGIG